MSLQAKLNQPHDPRLYSPNRDVAHNFDFVIKETADRCAAGQWAELVEYAKDKQISQEDLGRALQTLCYFVMSNTSDHRETMAQGLERSGFLGLKPAARVIVMAHLGTIVLGAHWAGVREATLNGQGPLLSYQNLVSYGRRLNILLRMNRFQRWWHRTRRRIRSARVAFFKDY